LQKIEKYFKNNEEALPNKQITFKMNSNEQQAKYEEQSKQQAQQQQQAEAEMGRDTVEYEAFVDWTAGVDFNRPVCSHCNFDQNFSRKCSDLCKKWFNNKCKCTTPAECVCESFKNNKLHWAVLSYINGFSWPHHYYRCECCIAPSWRNDPIAYKKGLVSIEVIISITKANPELALTRNICGKTPISLISTLISILRGVISCTSNNCSEDKWANHNLKALIKIEREILDIVEDVYT